jgi:tRNA-dihydrouridine synthase B
MKSGISGKFFAAPLAGYSDLPFRLISRRCGADVTVTEMVSVRGLIHGQNHTIDLIDITPEDHPVAVQLFGHEPEDFIKATGIVCGKFKPDMIDLNFGCPVRKVLKQKCGAWLLQDPGRISDIIKAVKRVATVPVSAKIRLGWDEENRNYLENAKAAEDAGADFLIVHGRTKTQLFSGEIDYKAIEEIKKAVSLPVVGNGNIADIASFRRIRDTGCDAYMIGRSIIGDPWLFTELKAWLKGETRIVPPLEKMKVLRDHFDLHVKYYGEEKGVRTFRSTAVQYIKKTVRKKIFIMELMTIRDSRSFLDLCNRMEEFLMSKAR